MGAKARAHRAYINIEFEKVADKAFLLPEYDLPSEILDFLENDNTSNKKPFSSPSTPLEGLSQNLEAKSAVFAA